MINSTILCSISTRGRYNSTLPLCLSAIINQTLLPTKIIIFDDNDPDKRIDLRENEVYRNLFNIMNIKGIEWSIVYGECKGQHYNHYKSNRMGFTFVWRVDDDVIPEPNTLKVLVQHMGLADAGAVGGSIIVPWWDKIDTSKCTGKLSDINDEPNIQWNYISEFKSVDHLHCSFLYRAGIVDYNLALSKKAHREETLFTYQLTQHGYKNYVVCGANSFHMKSSTGGIREDDNVKDYEHDEQIFLGNIEYGRIIPLHCGIGDHICFLPILIELLERGEHITLAVCYPEVFTDINVRTISIAEAEYLLGDISEFNIYKRMMEWDWKDSIEKAYRKLFL